ncbi:MAG: hypothetical protein ACKV19_29320 [Verrucomicrobiales bacterium]
MRENSLPRRATDAEEQGDMYSRLSKITLLFALALPAGAVNIAPGGRGIMGATQKGGSGDNAYYHDGQLVHLCDGNPATRVDNYRSFHQYYHTHGYAGVGWTAVRKESVKSVTVTMATFSDAGWFGSREVPPPGSALTPAHLRPDALSFSGGNGSGVIVEPIVQATRAPNPFTTNSWFTVASINDYVASLTGHVLPPPGSPPTSRSFTFTLRERPVGITGIRVVGPMGGTGCIGVFEIAVEADPVVDTDNDQMDDAWEAANGLNVGVNDANTDADDDDLVTLDEFGWRTNAQVQDTDGDGIFDGLERTYATHPNTFDTDGDGFSDGKEELSSQPGFVEADGAQWDLDHDGLSDFAEINSHLTNQLEYDTDEDGFGDGRELALGLNPLSATSRLPNLARSGRGVIGRIFWASGSSSFLQEHGTPITNGCNSSAIGDLSLTTLAHTSGNSQTSGAISNSSYAGIVLGERLPASVSITRIEVTFATYGHGGWFGTSGPAAGTALAASHLIVPELQTTNDGINWGTAPSTTDYLARMTGHVIGTSSVPTRRSAIFTFNTPQRTRGVRIAGRHRTFLGVYEISVTTNLDTTDTDADGLSNDDETTRGTSVIYSDTDEDGRSDFDEVNVHHSNPLVADAPGGPLVLHPVPSVAILGTGIIGVKTTLDGTPGNSVIHAGTAANIIDENPTTRVDSWNASGAGLYSFVGTSFGANQQTVAMLKVRFATFINGGWFGPTNIGPAGGGLITAAHLVEPAVQITTNGGTSWITVPHTSDYFTALTGHKIGDGTNGNFFSTSISHAATFTLNTPAENINGVRLVGLEGGSAQGFVGVFEFAAYSVAPPPPSTDSDADNDGLPDAWEIEKFGNITAQDADDDLDADGSNTLLEYGFNMNPNTFDTTPAPILENGRLTLTITKRPLVTYSILSGSTLLDFSTTDTTTHIDDPSTLKVSDNFPITGPAGRRFLRATVTAAP